MEEAIADMDQEEAEDGAGGGLHMILNTQNTFLHMRMQLEYDGRKAYKRLLNRSSNAASGCTRCTSGLFQ